MITGRFRPGLLSIKVQPGSCGVIFGTPPVSACTTRGLSATVPGCLLVPSLLLRNHFTIYGKSFPTRVYRLVRAVAKLGRQRPGMPRSLEEAWRPQGSPLLYHAFAGQFIRKYSSGDPCGRHASHFATLQITYKKLTVSWRPLRSPCLALCNSPDRPVPPTSPLCIRTNWPMYLYRYLIFRNHKRDVFSSGFDPRVESRNILAQKQHRRACITRTSIH